VRIPKMKITFKKEPKCTGLARIGEPYPNTNIKVNKDAVGVIAAPRWNTPDNKWEVRFTVKGSNGNPNCHWHWIRVKKRFDTESEAREWVKNNLEGLNLALYCFEQ
jgi:hypothetical protein